MKLSDPQRYALSKLAKGGIGCQFSDGEWSYMPFPSDERTYESLARRGLVIYRSVPHVQYNGYRITEDGREAIS